MACIPETNELLATYKAVHFLKLADMAPSHRLSFQQAGLAIARTVENASYQAMVWTALARALPSAALADRMEMARGLDGHSRETAR